MCGSEINRRSSKRRTHLCSFPIASFFVSLVTTRYRVIGFGRTTWRKEMPKPPRGPNNEQRWLSVSGPRWSGKHVSLANTHIQKTTGHRISSRMLSTPSTTVRMHFLFGAFAILFTHHVARFYPSPGPLPTDVLYRASADCSHIMYHTRFYPSPGPLPTDVLYRASATLGTEE